MGHRSLFFGKFYKWDSHEVTFRVLMAASINITAFWDIAPWSLVEVDRYFRGAYYLHHHRPLKRRSTSTRLHGAIFQKAVIFKQPLLLCSKKNENQLRERSYCLYMRFHCCQHHFWSKPKSPLFFYFPWHWTRLKLTSGSKLSRTTYECKYWAMKISSPSCYSFQTFKRGKRTNQCTLYRAFLCTSWYRKHLLIPVHTVGKFYWHLTMKD
jgi:hypothetical protein